MRHDEMILYSRSGTSYDTAVAIASKVPSMRMKVHTFIHRMGAYGATDEEVQIGLRMQQNTQAPRRYELERMGVVVDSGIRRDTTRGHAAIVWITRQQPEDWQADMGVKCKLCGRSVR